VSRFCAAIVNRGSSDRATSTNINGQLDCLGEQRSILETFEKERKVILQLLTRIIGQEIREAD